MRVLSTLFALAGLAVLLMGLFDLAFAFIPQDSGSSASGQWGWSIPFFLAAITLFVLAWGAWSARDP